MHAQQDTSFVQVPDVRVRADRWVRAPLLQLTATTVIGADYLDRLAPPVVADALTIAPGVAIRQYGGLGGMRTVSIRGGSTAQTLVMLDGIRLSTAQSGTVDLGLIPGSMIGSIDVHRGGAAALFGANALSGAVDLHLRRFDRPTAWATIGGGSFDEVHLRAGGGSTIGRTTIGGAIDVQQAVGGYPFALPYEGRTYDVDRVNADVRNINAVVRAASARWSALALFRSSQRGLPGPLVDGVIVPSRARLEDLDGILGAKLTMYRKGAWLVDASMSMRSLEQRFLDPEATMMGPTGINERYKQHDAMLAVQAQRITASDAWRWSVEGGYASLGGRMLQPEVGRLVVRRSLSAAGAWQRAIDSTVMVRAALRLDLLSDAGAALSPLASVRWTPLTDVALRASWSYNFRPPSFNELYYLNYGTSTLRPERSHALNVGVVWMATSWLSAEMDVFGMRTTDQILSVPTNAVAISAQNVGITSAVGIECGARATLWDDRLMAHWTYTLQDVRDRTGRPALDGTLLPYVPQEMIGTGLQYADADVHGGLTWTYVSHRYVLAGEAWSSMVPSYHLLGASVGVLPRLGPWQADVRVQVDNLLDARYDVIKGFPMPGRAFRVFTTLRWAP